MTCTWRTGVWTAAVLLVLVEIVLAYVFVTPGPFSIDEITYHAMVRSLLGGHGFFIDNGYTELPSVELTSMFILPTDGELAAQYPYLTAFLYAPFFAIFGLRGLFLVNAIAFCIATIVVGRAALILFRDRVIAVASAVLFAAGTYAWEYSMAAWPHSVTTALSVVAFYALVRSVIDDGSRHRAVWAAIAGLVAGLGVGVRADMIVIALALALPLIFVRPSRWRLLVAYAIGLVPGLLFCTYANYARWGVLSPISYGTQSATQVGNYLPMAALGLVAVVAAWWLSRGDRWRRVRARPQLIAVAAIAVVAAIVAIGPMRGIVERAIRGIATLVIDLRYLPLDRVEAGMMRTEGDAVVYVGVVKKALVQSLPYLPLVLVPLVSAFREQKRRLAILSVAAVPVLLIGFFSLTLWHGGMCFNLRYFVPALPFVAVLAVLGWVALDDDLHRRLQSTAIGLCTGCAMYWLLRPELRRVKHAENFVLDFGHVIALIVLLCVVLRFMRPGARTIRAAVIASAIAVAWAGNVAVDYDARSSRRFRDFNGTLGVELGRLVEDNSLLFVEFADHLATASEVRPGAILAFPWNDRFADFERLARYHIGHGRPVFAALRPPTWRQTEATGRLRGLRVAPVGQVGAYEIRRIEADTGE